MANKVGQQEYELTVPIEFTGQEVKREVPTQDIRPRSRTIHIRYISQSQLDQSRNPFTDIPRDLSLK